MRCVYDAILVSFRKPGIGGHLSEDGVEDSLFMRLVCVLHALLAPTWATWLKGVQVQTLSAQHLLTLTCHKACALCSAAKCKLFEFCVVPSGGPL
jgi:hypothetical protein